jgi:Flp pilus assembly protein TadB
MLTAFLELERITHEVAANLLRVRRAVSGAHYRCGGRFVRALSSSAARSISLRHHYRISQLAAVVVAVVLGVCGWWRRERPCWLAIAGVAVSLWFLWRLLFA